MNIAWRESQGGVLLHISLTPKSSSDSVGKVACVASGRVSRVKVRALPDKGKANQAVLKVLAEWLKIPKTSFELVFGRRSKLKTIKISGDFEEIVKKLETAVNLGLG